MRAAAGPLKDQALHFLRCCGGAPSADGMTSPLCCDHHTGMVWLATVAICCTTSRICEQSKSPPRWVSTCLRHPRANVSPTDPATGGKACGQVWYGCACIDAPAARKTMSLSTVAQRRMSCRCSPAAIGARSTPNDAHSRVRRPAAPRCPTEVSVFFLITGCAAERFSFNSGAAIFVTETPWGPHRCPMKPATALSASTYP